VTGRGRPAAGISGPSLPASQPISGGTGLRNVVRRPDPVRSGADQQTPEAWPRRESTPAVWLLAVIAVILAAAALRATMLVTMPLAFAFFVAVVMYPLEQALAARLPARLQWLAVLAAMLLIVSVVAVAVLAIWLALLPVTERAPGYVDRLQEQIDAWSAWAGANGISLPPDFDLAGTVMSGGAQSLVWGLTSAGEVLVFLLLVFFFTLLMLIEASAWRRKTQAALRRRHTAAVLETVGEVAHKVRRFFMVRSFVSLLAAVAQGSWLWLMGVDFVLFWAVVIFFLNYLPNVGSIVVGTLATLLAFVQFGFAWACLVAAGLVGIDQLLGNFLDPKLQGRSLNVSSLVVLVALIFWGWMWGVGGALLAVPLTVTIILVCAHVPALEPIATLLSGGPDDADEPA
jgi:AI-2 transport protein TqsA